MLLSEKEILKIYKCEKKREMLYKKERDASL